MPGSAILLLSTMPPGRKMNNSHMGKKTHGGEERSNLGIYKPKKKKKKRRWICNVIKENRETEKQRRLTKTSRDETQGKDKCTLAPKNQRTKNCRVTDEEKETRRGNMKCQMPTHSSSTSAASSHAFLASCISFPCRWPLVSFLFFLVSSPLLTLPDSEETSIVAAIMTNFHKHRNNQL